MKVGCEVIHGSVGTIQPHEQWDFSNCLRVVQPHTSRLLTKHVGENQSSNMESDELSEWVEHIANQLIDDSPDFSGGRTLHFDSSLEFSLLGESAEKKTGSKPGFDVSSGTHQWNIGVRCGEELSKADEYGLTLIGLLFECAVAISVDNLADAHRMLLELTQMASPYGSSCAERIVAYFAKAMASRVINSWLGMCFPLINHNSIHGALQVFNDVSPFIKFAHLTSNQAIFEAFHGRDRVHIVDLDIMQGLQWPPLFHMLVSRVEGPPQVRMTAIGTSVKLLVETGTKLSNFARKIGISFEFYPIARKFGDIETSMVQLRRGETLAVHWLQHSLYDFNGSDWKTLRLIQAFKPKIFTLVEQDITRGGSFLDRFVGSLHYYSAIFDSLGAYLPTEDPNRHHIESSLLYREINNILAIGGPSRSGEEKFDQWRSELRKILTGVPASGTSVFQSQLMLSMFSPAQGYTLVNGDLGTLSLGWKGTNLYTASAWTSPLPGQLL